MLPNSSSIPAILPNRYYTGFKTNPTAFCYFESGTSKPYLIVGTLNGTLEIVALEKGAIPEIKYEHKSETQINSIILISKESLQNGIELLWFNVKLQGNGLTNSEKIKSYSLTHYGFCQTIWDCKEKRMFIPGKDNDYELLTIAYENGGEKTISLGSEFLFSSFKKRHPETELTVDDCFEGTISSIQQIHETIDHDERDRLLTGFEDTTLIIYDIRTKEVITLLIAFAISKDPEHQRWRIAVTVCSRIFGIFYENQELELTKRIKKTGFAGVNCSHICYNKTGDTLICGYSSGRIEFYHVPEYNIFRVMNFHESTILSMNILTVFDNNAEILFIGEEDGRLSQTNMKKIEIFAVLYCFIF